MPELRDKVIQYHSDSATLDGLDALIVTNSDTDKNLQPGEIAVTTAPGNEGLHTLDSAGTGLVTYRPLSAVTGDIVKLNTYETATGNTSAELTPTEEDTVSQAFGKLTKAILDNEYTVALALTTMNSNVGFTTSGEMPEMTDTNFLTGSGTVVACLRALDAAVPKTAENLKLGVYETATGNTSDELMPTSADTVPVAFGKLTKAMLDNEYTVALALTTMNSNIGFTDQGRMPDMSGTNHLVGYNSVTSCLRALDLAIPATAENLKLGTFETATGNTSEELMPTSADTVPVAFGKLTKAMLDNEYTVSLALTTMNSSVGLMSDGTVPDLTETKYLGGYSTVVACLRALDTAIPATAENLKLGAYETATGTTESELTPASGDTIPVAFGKLTKAILDNEYVTALGLTTLNSNVGFGTNGNMPDLTNTTYLVGLSSVVGCLRALDSAIASLSETVSKLSASQEGTQSDEPVSGVTE